MVVVDIDVLITEEVNEVVGVGLLITEEVIVVGESPLPKSDISLMELVAESEVIEGLIVPAAVLITPVVIEGLSVPATVVLKTLGVTEGIIVPAAVVLTALGVTEGVTVPAAVVLIIFEKPVLITARLADVVISTNMLPPAICNEMYNQ